jgi:hypothetical protein
MNGEIGTEAAQFPEKEYINGIAVAVCRGKKILKSIRKEQVQPHALFRNTPIRDVPLYDGVVAG